MKEEIRVVCPYCKAQAQIVEAAEVYKNTSFRAKRYAKLWLCKPCWAYVGTHRFSKKHAPLGSLANAELRDLRQKVHALFDPLWKKKMQQNKVTRVKARLAGYKWLARELGVEMKVCHIGMMREDRCKQAVEILKCVNTG